MGHWFPIVGGESVAWNWSMLIHLSFVVVKDEAKWDDDDAMEARKDLRTLFHITPITKWHFESMLLYWTGSDYSFYSKFSIAELPW